MLIEGNADSQMYFNLNICVCVCVHGILREMGGESTRYFNFLLVNNKNVRLNAVYLPFKAQPTYEKL